ncbi:inverted ada-Golga3 fusion protein [Escherichia coli]|nr:inverted ada-Golga3 fusion protein [Escherichia coli]KZJ59207.1 inverted ada-Golga3 fusion protein [Escherichia coli]
MPSRWRKSGGECLTGICVEGDVFPQSMSGAARRTAKDACGAHGENEFAVGIRVAG